MAAFLYTGRFYGYVTSANPKILKMPPATLVRGIFIMVDLMNRPFGELKILMKLKTEVYPKGWASVLLLWIPD